MTLKVFSILDTVANAFNAPFFFPTVGQAVRAFKDLANDPNTAVSRHPADYALYELGTFEDSNGRLVALDVPNRLGRATDYLDSPMPEAQVQNLGAVITKRKEKLNG